MLLLLAACAHRGGTANNTGGSAGRTSRTAKRDSTRPLNREERMEDLSSYHYSAEEEGGEEGEEQDVAGTEKREETPEDLGDVNVSENRNTEEIQADVLSRKTFPLVYNEFVEQWIRYFTSTRGRPVMQKWLGRSTRYIPVMKKVLREEGLPEDLIYQAMIESGFNPKAASHAKAVGPWQFIKGTGKRYELELNYWVDERRDHIKSTHAAALYLKELHQIFGSWYLAAAAYNAGEGKVLRAVRSDRSRNFWELARIKKNFRAETRNYVPKIIAAALISKNPEKFGFTNVEYEEPLSWETIKVPGGVDLKSVAKLTGVDENYLEILNTELRRGVTPPGAENYALRVPPNKGSLVMEHIEELRNHRYKKNFIVHEVRKGDTLGAIARRYGSDVASIMELNKIGKTNRLKLGAELTIPVSDREESRKSAGSRNPSSMRKKKLRAR